MSDHMVQPRDGATIPHISVIVPVYNGEKYLTEAIDSILNQTVTDFELIAIDDGSTDSSLEILRNYERHDSRVRIFTRENRGLATTLSELVDLARGAWVARMDQDDIALPHRFARQLEWIDATGADICGSWVQRFGSSDRRIVKLCRNGAEIRMELLFRSPFAHPSVIMRAEVIKRLRYDKTWEKAEDYDLWERAAEAGCKLTNVPEVLLRYRIHGEQISTVTSVRQQQQGHEIRRRYWEFVFDSLHLTGYRIGEALKIFDASFRDVDMDAVDEVFSALLRNSDGESRAVIFEHATHLYLRAAAGCPGIVGRWNRLNREFGSGSGLPTLLKLALFRGLRMRPDGLLFNQLRRLYVWKASL